MAEEPVKKRRVRNPETFRERALKAAEESTKPKRQKRVRPFVGKVFGAIWKPFRWFGSLKLVKIVLKPFRFLGRLLIPSYFKSSWQELKQVTWPNWRQSRQLTFAVLIFAVIFGVTIAVVDYGLDKVFRNILLK